jgi:hypothetical protein
LCPHGDHFADRLLLGLVRDKLAGVAATEPEGNLAAKIPAPRPLVGLHLADALADTIALSLGKGGGDRQDSPGS